MHRLIRFGACGAVVATLALMLPLAASAHEARAIDGGKYQLVVGFLDEPAFTTVKNGLDLTVLVPVAGTPATGTDAAEAGTGVGGLDKTLQAEVIFGNQRMALPIEPRFGKMGAYNGWFFPMAAGDYSFHVFGTINGDKIDETFTSSPQGFSSVEDRSKIEFPKPSSSNGGIVAGSLFPTASSGAGRGDGLGGLGIGLAIGIAGLWLAQRRVASRHCAALAPGGRRAGAGN